jgi:hypothetical protein
MKNNDNFLDYIPEKAIDSGSADDGHIYLIKEKSKNRLIKKLIDLLGRSQNMHIHLDAQSSEAWRHSDGQNTVADIARLVQQKFGAAADPCYERTAKYFAIMKSNGFISFKPK